MPRSKKRTPRKSSLSKDASEESIVEDASATQEVDESMNEPTDDNEVINVGDKSIDTPEKENGSQKEQKEEDPTALFEDEIETTEQQEQDNEKKGDLGEPSENQETEKTEGGNSLNKSREENRMNSAKKEVSIEDMPVTPYMPHTIPDIGGSKLKEKWEWHMRIFPIDHSDIRRCVLDSVSKIAQETWYYIDKNNYGMGSYDLCMRSFTDTAMVMLKTLRAPMLYRYVTVEVSRRGKSEAEIEKIKQNPPLPEGSGQVGPEELEDIIDEAIENLPYTEVVESATLHLDYCHTIQCDKIKGKEKKRSLFVKNLPECTSKELLKVLFPVAISLDIISTEAGRRVGDLDVACEENLHGVIQAYVTVYINGCKNIDFAWNKDDLDNGETNPVADQESPWELLPRDDEIMYEAVPLIEADSSVQYRRNRVKMEGQQRRAAELQARPPNRRERRRMSRWDSEPGDIPPEAAEMIELQRAMNAKIETQLAILHAVGDRPQRGSTRGIPSLMRDSPDLPPGPIDPPGMRDRKRDRFERDRMDMDMGGRRRDFGPERMGMSERDMRGRPEFMPRDRERMFEDSRGRGPPMGMYGRGGKFDRGESERGPEFGGRFGGVDSRGHGFDFESREGRFANMGRGRGGFDSRGGGRGEAPGQRGMGRGGSQDRTRDQGDKTGKDQSQPKEGGPVDQKSGSKGGGRNKPVAHGFPASIEKQGEGPINLPQAATSSDCQGGNRGSGQGFPPRQGGFGNQSNQSNSGNAPTNQKGSAGDNKSFQGQGQNRGFNSQGPRNFGNNQNQQSGFGSQYRQRNFGSRDNQGNFGGMQNQNQGFGNSQMQNNFGSSQNQQRGFGGSQTQANYGSSGYQQSGYGSSGNQGNYGAIGNQAANYSSVNQMNSYNSSFNQQNSFGSSTNQQSLGTSQNQQSSYGSNQQSNYGTAQNASGQQSGYSNMQFQGYGNQQSYGNQQQSNNYGNYNTQQQPGYNSMQQQNYSTAQGYDSQQQNFGGETQQQSFGNQNQQQNFSGNNQQQNFGGQAQQQNFGNQGYGAQQQQMGYSTGGNYDWNQQASGTNTANNATGNYSQGSMGSGQQTQQQDYSSYSTAYPGYGGASLPSAATGYGADSAFANQGLYNATQGNQALDPYGGYNTGTADSYGTNNQQSAQGAYNYSQYQGNAS